MHSPSEDLVAFKHACGVVPKPLFDTQLAAALAGVGGGLGYQKLVRTAHRRHAGQGRDALGLAAPPAVAGAARIRRRRRAPSVRDARPASTACSTSSAAATGWPKTPRAPCSTPRTKRPNAGRTCRCAARSSSTATRSAACCACCAGATPTRATTTVRATGSSTTNWPSRSPASRRSTAPALQRQLDAHPKAPRKLGDAIWRALNTPLADEADAPDATAAENRDKQRLRKLQDAVAARSAELGLPDGVLASRRWLEALLDRAPGPTPCPAGAARHWKRI